MRRDWYLILDAGAPRRDNHGPTRAISDMGRPRPAGRCYVYAPDRKHARPAAHVGDVCGTPQVDGYGAYADLAEKGGVVLAFCWSHVRRRFYELQGAATPALIAREALVRIAALYAIEADIRGLTADERRHVRQRRTKPLIEVLVTGWEQSSHRLVSAGTEPKAWAGCWFNPVWPPGF
jgi:transposase